MAGPHYRSSFVLTKLRADFEFSVLRHIKTRLWPPTRIPVVTSSFCNIHIQDSASGLLIKGWHLCYLQMMLFFWP